MDKNLLIESLGSIRETDFVVVMISFALSILSSFILMHVYKRKSNSLSSKIQIAPIIPLITNITFLVILVVKSSLALSLGLVGALSVIRFRTPIKEPEDLGFLFLSIALGIGYGANQIYITSIVFLVIILMIWFFFGQASNDIKNDYNLIIEFPDKFKKKESDNLIDILKQNTQEIEVNKIEKDQKKIIYFYRVIFSNNTNIHSVIEKIENDFPEVKFYFYENRFID